jgi:hypothetical protein
MPPIDAIKAWNLFGVTLLLACGLILGCTQDEFVIVDATEIGDVSVETDQVAAPEAEQPQGPPSREDWQRRREEMLDQLNLTDEQRAQLEDLDRQYTRGSSRENREARREAMAEILTEEQMTQMREMFRRGRPRD